MVGSSQAVLDGDVPRRQINQHPFDYREGTKTYEVRNTTREKGGATENHESSVSKRKEQVHAR